MFFGIRDIHHRLWWHSFMEAALWHPVYWVSAYVKVLTAVASLRQLWLFRWRFRGY